MIIHLIMTRLGKAHMIVKSISFRGMICSKTLVDMRHRFLVGVERYGMNKAEREWSKEMRIYGSHRT